MSLDATRWAWKIAIPEGKCLKANKRLVLLSFADRAGEEHTAFPSAKRLKEDTCLDRKTILAVIHELINDGLIEDTGERKGPTKQVRVFRLLGVIGRETVPPTEPFQQRNRPNKGTNNDPNDGMPNDPNDGIRNLSFNLSMNLSLTHEWVPEINELCSALCLKGYKSKLKGVIELPEFEFELAAFNAHYKGKVISEGKKLYSFVTWISEKYERHVKQNPEYEVAPTKTGAQPDQPQAQVRAVPKKYI